MSEEQILSNLYSAPIQGGGDLPYFVGKQYGSGWLRTLGRFAFPILKRIVGVALNTGDDVVSGRKAFKDSLRDNAMSEMGNFMSGRGALHRRKSINKKRKRRATSPINTIFKRRQ